ncbi:MAG: carbon storage regulator [Nanoarchaeota archaeon]
MLVLSRSKDKEIYIEYDPNKEPIKINVLDIRGDKVSLGITAPKEFPVHRKEVYDAILREEERLRGKERGYNIPGGLEEK